MPYRQQLVAGWGASADAGDEDNREQAGWVEEKSQESDASVTKRLIAIAYAGRRKGEEGEKKRKQQYRELLRLTRQILNDIRRVLNDVEGLGRGRRAKVKGEQQQLQTMAERLRQVVKQTQGRIFGGMTKLPDQLLSLFECASVDGQH